MPATTEGITVGEQAGLDPNNPDDFAAILEGRGVPKTEDDGLSIDTSIASGLTVAGPEQPRDPESGRFVPNEPAAPDTSAEAATDTSGAGDEADPEVAALLAKFGGDKDAALKSAAHASSLVGRRSEAEQALQEKLANLEGKLEALTSVQQTQQPTVRLSDDQIVEVATNEIERKGYDQAATEAANFAHTAGDERAYRTILEQWNLEDPIAAMDFNTDFRIWQRDARQAATQQAPETPAWQATAQAQAEKAALTATIEAVAGERGVPLDSPVFAQFSPALEAMPKNVAAMIASNDPEAVAAGIGLVMDRATILAGTAPQAPATPAAAAAAAVPASVERKLAGAAVASGALRPAEKAATGAPQNREDAIKEFKRQIVEAETTSIASGLTYGPTQ